MDVTGMIRFERLSDQSNVVMDFSNDVTWMEATNEFIGFLHACGYIFDPQDVGNYISNYYKPLQKKCACKGCCK